MLKLADLSPDKVAADSLRERAQRLMLRLTEACFETAPEAQGLLRDSSYNVNTNAGVEQFMPFGDYYYLEGLLKLTHPQVDFWGKPTSSGA
jgi:unsaturated chondroitin disaccharide hydrolase